MPDLVLGPILRHVEASEATVWVETDAACEVEILGSEQPTFAIEGHHYALLELDGLEQGRRHPYSVRLDGVEVWPQRDSELPPSSIRPTDGTRDLRVVFGSCRVSLPHEPPYVLHQSEHPDAQGIDALRTLALRLIREQEPPPDCLLMLGDQVYADDLSPALREVTENRSDHQGAPVDELISFDEYALAYREAWSEPVIRWLLSTVPTAMIFDDHEIHAQWKISARWHDRLAANDWYEAHISGGLMAYWIYQHIGNLSLAELTEHDLLAKVREAGAGGDAGPLLRREMAAADQQASHSRWSYYRDLGRTRMLVIDSRAGRELEPGRRLIIEPGEWEWIAEHARGDFDHLLLASSVPFLLPPGLHNAEAWDAALADGAWGRWAQAPAERIRERAVMDHWASFPASFEQLCDLLAELASEPDETPPASIVMLSGDVHHCYLAEVGFPPGTGARSAVWQAVCSAYRKDLAPRERRTMRIANSWPVELIARGLARAAGARRPPIDWRLVERPNYENQVASLELGPGRARVRVESANGSDWRDPDLDVVFEHQLAGEPTGA